MPKVNKSFRFQYDFKKSQVVGTRLCTDRLPVTVEAMAYRKTHPFDNDPEFSVDVVQVFFGEKEVTRVLCFFEHMDELTQAALELAPAQFREEEAKRDVLQEKLRYIASVIKTVKGHSILTLHEPITLRTDDFQLCEIHGLSISSTSQVYAHDASGMPWHVEVEDLRATKIINAIEARLNKDFGTMEQRRVAI